MKIRKRFSQIREIYRPFTGAFIILSCLILSIQLLGLVAPYFYGRIIDQYRKHKTTSLDVLVEKGYEPSVDTTKSLINVLDGKTALTLIARLPESYRKIMRMKYVQALSLAEMSLLTGQTKNTIAVQLHRGLAKLKVLYARGGKVDDILEQPIDRPRPRSEEDHR